MHDFTPDLGVGVSLVYCVDLSSILNMRPAWLLLECLIVERLVPKP